MKTRVVKKQGKFIPQYKPLGCSLWKEFEDKTSSLNGPLLKIKAFDSVEEAELFIIEHFD